MSELRKSREKLSQGRGKGRDGGIDRGQFLSGGKKRCSPKGRNKRKHKKKVLHQKDPPSRKNEKIVLEKDSKKGNLDGWKERCGKHVERGNSRQSNWGGR